MNDESIIEESDKYILYCIYDKEYDYLGFRTYYIYNKELEQKMVVSKYYDCAKNVYDKLNNGESWWNV